MNTLSVQLTATAFCFASVSIAMAGSPEIDAGTWAGSPGDDYARCSAVAPDGSIYIAGYTSSPFMPNALNSMTGDLDMFVLKLSADMTDLQWSVYVGGSGTFEFPSDCATTADGGIVVTGKSDASNFPTLNAIDSTLGGQSDAVLFKLDADGNMVFSTYLGGSGPENAPDAGFSKYIGEVEVASDGSIFVAGNTRSEDFPLVNPIDSTFGGFFSDVFVMKISADGQSILASTYLGDLYEDEVWGMQLDAEDRPVIVGNGGPEWPQTTGAFSYGTPSSSGIVFATKLTADGQGLEWSSRIDRVDDGGGHIDYINVAIAPDGSVIAVGEATGSGFPVPPSAFQPEVTSGNITHDAVALVYSSDGSEIIGGTFYGSGNGIERSRAVGVNSLGEILLSVQPTELITFNPAMTEILEEPIDLAPSGAVWSLHVDENDDVIALIFTLAGITTPGAFQEVNPGGESPYIVRWNMMDLSGNASDLTGDGVVDGADLALLLGVWGACENCDTPADCPADLDGDCEVTGADLAILLGNWG